MTLEEIEIKEDMQINNFNAMALQFVKWENSIKKGYRTEKFVEAVMNKKELIMNLLDFDFEGLIKSLERHLENIKLSDLSHKKKVKYASSTYLLYHTVKDMNNSLEIFRDIHFRLS